jgi:uncharacterized repeat protein (TIGR03803 family)
MKRKIKAEEHQHIVKASPQSDRVNATTILVDRSKNGGGKQMVWPSSNLFGGGVRGMLLALALGLSLTPILVMAATVKVLAPFQFNDPLGQFPQGALAIGTDGNFYGVTESGAANNQGAVFKVSPAGSLSKIVDFDGTVISPFGPVFGPDGNLYGVSTDGNVNSSSGSAFKVTLSGSGNTLSSFASNGSFPHASLVLGSDGSLYGTTEESGTGGQGTVFRMTTGGQFTRLASFPGPFVMPQIGAFPDTALVEGNPGVFYGTTINGANNSGTIYVATSAGSLSLLYTFSATDGNGLNSDGSTPNDLVYGSDGNLYGTTSGGGTHGAGTVFKITTSGSFTTLVSFDGVQGGRPMAGLVEGSDHNFYGTTTNGGAANSGIVFKITSSGTLTVLAPLNADIAAPSKLVQGTDGKFYGTGQAAGATNAGCVFVVDAGLSPLTPTVLGNISTRGVAQTGDNVMIGGFVIGGSGNKSVLVRAIGPSLSRPPINLTNTLQNPTLSLFDGSGAMIASNDDWGQAANAQSIPSNLQPTDSAESAILISLPPGGYTAIVSGVNGGTGIALVEVFDLDSNAASRLINISTRGLVQTGDNVMIGGFIINGPNSGEVVVRAIGPSLSNPPFNIANALQNPSLFLFDANGNMFASNDDWRSDQRDEIIATGLQPPNDAESAIVITLTPGNYTAIVRGVNGTTGVGLVEVYGQN